MSAHALLSPSSAHRWMRCTGAPSLERGQPETSNAYADEGTVAHLVAAKCLEEDVDAVTLIGEVVELPSGSAVEITGDMVVYAQQYVDYVRSQAQDADLLTIEDRLDIGHLTGETGAQGTADAVVLKGSSLHVIDLKYGRGVGVEADNNEQLMLYALAALDKYGLACDISDVWLTICQPRVSGEPSQFVIEVEDLLVWKRTMQEKAELALATLNGAVPDLVPGDKQCRFCRAKAACPALYTKVLEAAASDFEALPDESAPGSLSEKMDMCDLLEGWVAAVRAAVERNLLSGVEVPGYKLVAGRRGARAWTDADAAEAALKVIAGLSPEAMYVTKIISPVAAEKLLSKEHPDVWELIVAKHVTQAEGQPSVARADDKRPALSLAATPDDFEREG